MSALAYNRRGHDILSIRNSRDVEGGALQLTSEAIADNTYAREWLLEKGYSSPICVGHSNGGVLATKHAATYKDTPALILLSPHIGGKDMLPIASSKGLFGASEYPEIINIAKEMISNGKGDELISMPGWYWITTPRSIVDLATNLPHLIEEAPKIKCPVLFIRGDQEPKNLYPAEAFKNACNSTVDIVIIENSNHFYVSAENTVKKIICDWIRDKIISNPNNASIKDI
jgi:pimeloyl-ACP methyl ester carboxylesterase